MVFCTARTGTADLERHLSLWNLQITTPPMTLLPCISELLLTPLNDISIPNDTILQILNVHSCPSTASELLLLLQSLLHDKLLEFTCTVDITYEQQIELAHQVCQDKWMDIHLVDTVLICLSSFLHLPIILHTTMPSLPIIPFLPQTGPLTPIPPLHLAMIDNHLFYGCTLQGLNTDNPKTPTEHHLVHKETPTPCTHHKDLAIKNGHTFDQPTTSQKETHCSCGHAKQTQQSCTQSTYKSRCPCLNNHHPCTSLCTCRKCTNPYGTTSKIPSKRPHLQLAMNNTAKKRGIAYLEENSEPLKTGKYTQLEYFMTSILLKEQFGLSYDDSIDLQQFEQTYNNTVHCIQVISFKSPVFSRKTTYLQHIISDIKFYHHYTSIKGLTQ